MTINIFNFTISRTILAALHFNYNIKREPQKDDQGQAKLRVTYVKYKYGDGTVREAKTPPNYGNYSAEFLLLSHTVYIFFSAERENRFYCKADFNYVHASIYLSQ
jgi:hypothetical protein